jgi:hypothetical protein
MIKYLVMTILQRIEAKEYNDIILEDIILEDKEAGLYGMMPIFNSQEEAQKAFPDRKILKMEIEEIKVADSEKNRG